MKFSEVLSFLEDNYPPGCAEYYASFNPDPWIAAFERLGVNNLEDQDPATPQSKVEIFKQDLVHLMLGYMKKQRKESLPWYTGLYSSVQNVNLKVSIQDKHCAFCAGGSDLIPVKKNYGFATICIRCKDLHHELYPELVVRE